MPVLSVATLSFLLLGVLALFAGRQALRGGRPLGAGVRVLVGLALVALAGLAGTLELASRGYRAFTAEQLAATLRIEPLPDKRFHATIVLPGQPVAMFDLAGDVFSIDARILAWHPLMSALGLHAAYELDRVAGRYRGVAEDRGKPLPTYPLAQPKTLDMFRLVNALPILTVLVNAEHKSAAVTIAGRAANFDVLVSRTGLVIRPAAP